jgi:hypothetical protein
MQERNGKYAGYATAGPAGTGLAPAAENMGLGRQNRSKAVSLFPILNKIYILFKNINFSKTSSLLIKSDRPAKLMATFR